MSFLRKMLPLWALAACAAFWAVATPSLRAAEDLLPPETAIEKVVDHYVDLRLKTAKITPAPLVNDAGYIRRVMLDLAGRVPQAFEVKEFVSSSDPDKRVKLVDKLLASPDYAYHLCNEYEVMLLSGKKGDGPFREYLLKALQENRAWDKMFREMLLGREEVAEEKPALTFLKSRVANLDDITNDTSKIFFGVSINCAKCHDHPLVLDWTQDHFYGMASFFNRTYASKKGFLGERDEGTLKFKPKEAPEKEAKLMFLTGTFIEEPAAPMLSEQEKKDRKKAEEAADGPPPAPKFSRRAKLVELALKPSEDSFFAKSFVNRVWNRLYGRGLVMPIDQMHSANPPSHPELLTWLARDAMANNYDTKRLIRGLVLSQAYSRSSRWESGTLPDPDLFATMAIKPLTPAQYSLSLILATGNPVQQAASQAKPEDWASRRKQLESSANGFANRLEYPTEHFQVGVTEALLFTNNSQIENQFLREGNESLVGYLNSISDLAQRIEVAFLSVYGRPPEAEELAAITRYYESRQDRVNAATKHLVWSLITNGEFRFNY